MKRIILTALCVLCVMLASAAGADVIINEVMASNGTYENGNAYDWVELYNDGKKAMDISGWYLSDSKTRRNGRFRTGQRSRPADM